MKPILLKLAGLQSYREAQEIDFTELCETGLFGIFGPTGSGKSTLLDAMTLALYGKVERAVNGTQGIMNHSEDSLFVSFTFELTGPKGSSRYRVERRFKRTGEQSVSCTISRFIEITAEGERVEADKLAEVNRCVEEKIGLKMDDFTRAVVLPQGKFSEFLSLKGSERRQMLQRLFHLEKYGDQLALKLSRKIKETDGRMKELAAEQQGLGLASKEAVKEAAAKLAGADQQAKEVRKRLLEARVRAEESGKIRELIHEQHRLLDQQTRLTQKEPAIEAAEHRLRHAEAAGALLPVLTAWKEAKAAAGDQAQRAQAAAKKAAADQAVAVEAEEKARLAGETLEREEPGLVRRLEQLEQALQLQEEASHLKSELELLTSRKLELEQKQKLFAEESAKEEGLLHKAVQRRKELELQLKETEVKSADRRLLQEGMQRKEALSSAGQQLEQARTEAAQLQKKHAEAERNLQQMTADGKRDEQERLALLTELLQLAAELNGQQKELTLLGEALELREEHLRGRLKEQELHVWSVRLADGLQDGSACPVCGAQEHPAPAVHGGGESAALEAELQAAALLLPECRELRFGAARDLEAARAALESLDAAEHPAASGEAAAAAEAAPAAAAGPGAPLDAESARARLAALRSARGESGTRLAALQSRARGQRSAGADLRQRCALAAAEAASAAALLEQQQSRCSALEADVQRRAAEWEAAHPGVTPDELQQSFEALHAKDLQADDIRHRLEVSVPFIEDKTSRLAGLSEQLAALDKELVECTIRLEGLLKLLEEKVKRLEAITQGEPAAGLLAAAESRLLQLRGAAKQSREALASAEQLRNESAKADVLARQAAEAAYTLEDQQRSRWLEALAQSPFAMEYEAAEAAMSPEEAKELMELVQVHRKQQQELAVTLRDLEARLGGRTITEEEWRDAEQALANRQTEDELALQEKAKAQRDLEDVEQRHIRWQELEGQRVVLEHETGLLGKLQSSLRGNAFVEYVAEEQLVHVSQAASQRLRFLTKQRYSLETDSGGGFVIRDDANGGVKRPVSTLSGGETFLTSLALALALSAQIQLRGQYPLQFFFLDEGFGTLDPELLDTVITSLEHLHHDHLSVGVISHVAELRERLPRKLIVQPAENAGEGSRIRLEKY